MNCGLGLEVPSGLGWSGVLKGLGVLARNSFAGRVGGVVEQFTKGPIGKFRSDLQ